MAAERQSMPDLREFLTTGSEKDENLFMKRAESCMNVPIEKAENDIEENSLAQIKPKTKKRHSWKSKRKIYGIESPGDERRKEKVSIPKRVKRFLTRKRVKNSYSLQTPKVEVQLNGEEDTEADALKPFSNGQNEDIKNHETIHVKPLKGENDPINECTCTCECVKKLEGKIRRLENQNLMLTNGLAGITQNICVKKCQTVQISGSDPEDFLEQVRSLVESLKEENEDLKRIAKDISKRVEEMQHYSTQDRSQYNSDMMQLQQLVKEMISKTQKKISVNPENFVLQPKCSHPRDLVSSSHTSLVDNGVNNGRCVVWGRSDVIQNLSGRQSEILERQEKMQGSLENVQMHVEKFSAVFDSVGKLSALLSDRGTVKAEL